MMKHPTHSVCSSPPPMDTSSPPLCTKRSHRTIITLVHFICLWVCITFTPLRGLAPRGADGQSFPPPAHPHDHQTHDSPPDTLSPARHSAPQYAPTTSVACCLPHWPVDYHGQPVALTNKVLFGECPRRKTPEEICKTAGEALAEKPHLLVADPHLLPLAEETTFFYDSAQSPAAAQVAIVGKGCCFNLYPDVQPHQPLSSECTNPLLGDHVELISSVFSPSIISAGDVNIVGEYSNSVVIGGNYSNRDATTTIIASQFYGGVYPTAGLVVVGDVAQVGGPIQVQLGEVFLGGSDRGNRIEAEGGAVRVITDRRKAIRKIVARVCAVSQNIAKLESNSEANTFARLSNDRVLTAIELPCKLGSALCVFHITADQLNIASDIIYIAASDATVKINVSGLFVDTIANHTPATATVVWNFYEAQSITILGDWVGSIICPRCEVVDITTTLLVGTVALGLEGSEFRLSADGETVPEVTTRALPDCPPPRPELVLCECLCTKKSSPSYRPVELIAKP